MQKHRDVLQQASRLAVAVALCIAAMLAVYARTGHFTNAVLWQQGAEKFVCMEPWNGYPGSMRGKHEVLEAGKSLAASFEIEI